MAVVLTSTTEPQQNLDHAVSDNWREAPEVKAKAEPAPEVEPEQEPVEVPEEPAEPAAEPEEPETETEAAKAKPEVKEHKPSRKEQARIDELTKRWKLAEAEKETAKRELAIARGEIAETPASEPSWDEYQAQGRTHDEWVEHHDAWKKAEYDFYQKAGAYNKQGQSKYKDWNSLQKEVAEKSDVVFPPLVGNAINKALFDEENAADVIYYLWNHVDEGHQLAAMPPDKAGRYIAKLAAKLELSDKPAAVVPKAKVAPPAPITPVQSTGTKTSVPLEKMSMKEFMRERNKQEIAKRRGL